MNKDFQNSDPDEKIAIAECKKQNPDGSEYLIKKYKNYIFTIIVRHNIYNEEADELFQDIFLKVISNIRKYRKIFK